MKLTFTQLMRSLGNEDMGDPGAFNRFAANPMPLKTSVTLKSIIRAVGQQVQDFHETRLEICRRLGTLNDQTNKYEFGENEAAWNTEYAELLGIEIEIPGPRFTIANLLSSLIISPHDLLLLDWLIDDGTPRSETPIPFDAKAEPSGEDVPETTEMATAAAN